MAERLKIYFGCAIRGEQGGQEEKDFIVRTMQGLGHEVLSEIFTGMDKDHNQTNAGASPTDIYHCDMSWVDEADIIVADITRISSGLGFEMGWKVKSGGRVMALCREDRYEPLSNILKGCDEPNYSLHRWDSFDRLAIILEEQLGRVE
jgi:2'-deoxynucleoside 5'-phosphate N-hydrolase